MGIYDVAIRYDAAIQIAAHVAGDLTQKLPTGTLAADKLRKGR